MNLLLATHNTDKAQEFESLLTGLGVGVLTLEAFPSIGPIEENAGTLEGNALVKAEAVFRATGLPSLADDTGLEVHYLNGAPGVMSARYAGEGATYAENVALLLRNLRGVPERRRASRFRCVLAFIVPGMPPLTEEGICRGRILERPRGEGGFGYDSVFLPVDETESFAEMPPARKNALSHRGRAIGRMLPHLRDYFARPR
jgi:XTP/dITP diphosphohydrolase